MTTHVEQLSLYTMQTFQVNDIFFFLGGGRGKGAHTCIPCTHVYSIVLIRTPFLTKNSVLIREVSFGAAHAFTEYLLQKFVSFIEGWSF